MKYSLLGAATVSAASITAPFAMELNDTQTDYINLVKNINNHDYSKPMSLSKDLLNKIGNSNLFKNSNNFKDINQQNIHSRIGDVFRSSEFTTLEKNVIGNLLYRKVAFINYSSQPYAITNNTNISDKQIYVSKLWHNPIKDATSSVDSYPQLTKLTNGSEVPVKVIGTNKEVQFNSNNEDDRVWELSNNTIYNGLLGAISMTNEFSDLYNFITSQDIYSGMNNSISESLRLLTIKAGALMQKIGYDSNTAYKSYESLNILDDISKVNFVGDKDDSSAMIKLLEETSGSMYSNIMTNSKIESIRGDNTEVSFVKMNLLHDLKNELIGVHNFPGNSFNIFGTNIKGELDSLTESTSSEKILLKNQYLSFFNNLSSFTNNFTSGAQYRVVGDLLKGYTILYRDSLSKSLLDFKPSVQTSLTMISNEIPYSEWGNPKKLINTFALANWDAFSTHKISSSNIPLLDQNDNLKIELTNDSSWISGPKTLFLSLSDGNNTLATGESLSDNLHLPVISTPKPPVKVLHKVCTPHWVGSYPNVQCTWEESEQAKAWTINLKNKILISSDGITTLPQYALSLSETTTGNSIFRNNFQELNNALKNKIQAIKNFASSEMVKFGMAGYDNEIYKYDVTLNSLNFDVISLYTDSNKDFIKFTNPTIDYTLDIQKIVK